MFECISLWTSTRDIKQLSEQHHAGVGLARPAGPREDDGLGVAGLTLDLDGLLGDFVECIRLLGGFLGGVEGDGVAHVIVRVDGDQDWSNVGLEFE